MNKLLIILLAGIFFLTGNGVAQTLPSDEKAIAAKIESLGSPNSGVRETAAKELRGIIARYPSGTSNIRDNDGGKAFWVKKIDQIVPGMLKAEVLKMLPPFAEFPETFSIGSGQSHNLGYRLDNNWMLKISFRNPDRVIDRPTLVKRERSVNVKTPENYTGKWTSWHVNGQKALEIEFKDGKYHGLLTCFYDSGQKFYVQHYVDNVGEGADTGWAPDGQLLYTVQYKNGKQDGQWLHFFSDGRKWSEVNYKNGVLHGLMAQWYENGQMRFEKNYQNGVLNGTDAAWNEQGVLQYKREYRNGEIVE